MQRSECSIGLLDHIGGGNLGDDATQQAVVQNIRKRQPAVAMSLFSMNPADSRTRHGLPAYAIRRKTWELGYGQVGSKRGGNGSGGSTVAHPGPFSRLLRGIVKLPAEVWKETAFLLKSFRIVQTLDLLIINGGGQLTDACGPWSFPYQIYKWVLLARLARVRCWFLNVGAGPLSHPLSRLFARRALRTATYVSFRDGKSQALAREIGFRGQSQVLPDSVYGLEISAATRESLKTPGRPVVGLSPKLGVPESNGRGPEGDLIDTLARFACWLEGRSFRLAFFGTDVAEDLLAIEDLETAIHRRRDGAAPPCSDRYAVKSLDELLSTIAAMDYVVTCRFHGVIFAHLLNKPVLAISPHPKVKTLMKDLDLAEYCVDAGECDLHRLTDTFTALVSNADGIRSRMAERLTTYKSQLAAQFDQLFPSTTAN